MVNKNQKWQDMPLYEKIFYVLSLLSMGAMLVVAVLAITSVITNVAAVAVPIVAVFVLSEAVISWKYDKLYSAFYICLFALFIYFWLSKLL